MKHEHLMGSYVKFLECAIINKKLGTSYTPDEIDRELTLEERVLIVQWAVQESERY